MSDRDEMAMRFAVVAFEAFIRNHTGFWGSWVSDRRFEETLETIPEIAYDMADKMAAHKEKEQETNARRAQLDAGIKAQVPFNPVQTPTPANPLHPPRL